MTRHIKSIHSTPHDIPQSTNDANDIKELPSSQNIVFETEQFNRPTTSNEMNTVEYGCEFNGINNFSFYQF